MHVCLPYFWNAIKFITRFSSRFRNTCILRSLDEMWYRKTGGRTFMLEPETLKQLWKNSSRMSTDHEIRFSLTPLPLSSLVVPRPFLMYTRSFLCLHEALFAPCVLLVILLSLCAIIFTPRTCACGKAISLSLCHRCRRHENRQISHSRHLCVLKYN